MKIKARPIAPMDQYSPNRPGQKPSPLGLKVNAQTGLAVQQGAPLLSPRNLETMDYRPVWPLQRKRNPNLQTMKVPPIGKQV